ncbi:MAG: Gldg family protein [Planctomycetia bacterium]|nr:Gldg family protein [Planctomycetia bacterium]
MYAVFKRNFLAYFLNPTGYVFICVFVLLSSVAAFLPDEFVNSNLANLAQLNAWFPLIILVFAPAVAMSAWAEERRLGADELLVTQPITSWQIVLGKFCAAVLVYTVSLLFSAFSNYIILRFLGNPDLGLFCSTYLGYWLVGVAAVSLAMVVSFAVSQLTVAYILGALLNVPLVALKWSDALPVNDSLASALRNYSVDASFATFGRGVASLSSTLYFLAIPAASLYLCVLILDHKRLPAKSARLLTCHHLFRFLAFLLLTVAIVGFTRDHDLRADLTEEKLSALSPETLKLIDHKFASYPIVIEARLSAKTPTEYVQTKLNIVSVLNELKNKSKSPVFLDIQEIAPNTPEAYRLERQYDIRPRKVAFNTRGQVREDSIFMSIVFRCGPKTLVIPFLNRGLSVEYELVSALLNVSSPPKKRIGILLTDAGALGRFDDYGRELQKPWPLLDELSKQYYVEAVDPSAPILPGRYDVLMAFQPSSLGTVETLFFTNAVKNGQPTIIFEDPKPIFLDFLTGTLEPRQPTPTNPIPALKGELSLLWLTLGIRFDGGNVLWKNYNPYPKLAGLSEEYLFVDARPIQYDATTDAEKTNSAKTSFNAFNPDDPIVSSLEHILFPFVGAIVPLDDATTTFTPLIQTEAGGGSAVSDIIPQGVRTRSRKRIERAATYTLAARITGLANQGARAPGDEQSRPMNVVVVADVDMATPGFFTLRESGADARFGVAFDFDNISFVLNAVDSLAQEESLIAIRSRRPRHRALTRIEDVTRKIRDQATISQIAYMKEFEEERRKEEAALQTTVQELMKRDENKKELKREESLELQSAIVAAQQRLNKVLDDKKRLFDHKVEEEQRQVDEYVRQTQSRYKTCAALLPPTPPLIIGLCVWLYRRRRQGSHYGY